MEGAPDLDVSALAYSSRSVRPGTLFFCVPGFKADGHDFAADAVERGAVALVVERRLDLPVPQIGPADARGAVAEIAARFYPAPPGELRVGGGPGTNGKPTTTFLIRS